MSVRCTIRVRDMEILPKKETCFLPSVDPTPYLLYIDPTSYLLYRQRASTHAGSGLKVKLPAARSIELGSSK